MVNPDERACQQAMATAFVLVKAEPGWTDHTHRALATIPGVVEVEPVFGEHDFVCKVKARDVGSVGDIIVDRIRRAPGVAATETLAAASKR